MIKRALVLFCLLYSSMSFSNFSFEQCDRFSLRGGIGFHTTSVLANNQSTQQLLGSTLSTSVNFRLERFEFGVNSLMVMGLSNRNNVQYIQGSRVIGRYWYRALSFGPVIRYYAPWTSKWEVYGTFSPLWEIITLSPYKTEKVKVEGGSFQKENGLRYLGRGGMLGFGILKNTPNKTDQIYYELTYKVIRPYRLVVMKNASWKETIVETKEDIQQKITEHTIAFNVGIIFF